MEGFSERSPRPKGACKCTTPDARRPCEYWFPRCRAEELTSKSRRDSLEERVKQTRNVSRSRTGCYQSSLLSMVDPAICRGEKRSKSNDPDPDQHVTTRQLSVSASMDDSAHLSRSRWMSDNRATQSFLIFLSRQVKWLQPLNHLRTSTSHLSSAWLA